MIIPAYNGERFIAQAIASARRQNPPVSEIIVVDDGSTDGTAKVVKGLAGVRYVYQVNQGLAAARNHGFRVSRGNLLCFLDADDRLTGSKTEVQFPMLAENPTLDIVIGFSQRVVITGWDGVEPVYREIGEPQFYLSLGSAIIRRSVFERLACLTNTWPWRPSIEPRRRNAETWTGICAPRKAESECAFTGRSCSTTCGTIAT